jgi:hypothetical protein
MNGIRLTRRGKIVVGVLIASFAIGFNVLISGKYVSCDLRSQPITSCEIKEFGK